MHDSCISIIAMVKLVWFVNGVVWWICRWSRYVDQFIWSLHTDSIIPRFLRINQPNAKGFHQCPDIVCYWLQKENSTVAQNIRIYTPSFRDRSVQFSIVASVPVHGLGVVFRWLAINHHFISLGAESLSYATSWHSSLRRFGATAQVRDKLDINDNWFTSSWNSISSW